MFVNLFYQSVLLRVNKIVLLFLYFVLLTKARVGFSFPGTVVFTVSLTLFFCHVSLIFMLFSITVSISSCKLWMKGFAESETRNTESSTLNRKSDLPWFRGRPKHTGLTARAAFYFQHFTSCFSFVTSCITAC